MMIGTLRGDSHKIGSMGKPAPIYDIALLDTDGNEVKAGEVGEICVNIKKGRPFGLFTEYYNDPEKTAESISDGFYPVVMCLTDDRSYFVMSSLTIIRSIVGGAQNVVM